jgi:hypothetical protein
MTRHKLFTAVLVTAALVSAQAQTTQDATPTTPKHAKKTGTGNEEIRLLREQMQKQQDEIDALKAQINEKTAAAQQSAADAQSQAAAANTAATQASSSSSDAATKADSLTQQVTDLKAKQDALTDTVVANQAAVNAAIDSPSTIHYKGVELTPIGFLAAETVNRSKSINSDINTPFNSTPYPNSGQAYTSEFNGSGRQSRIGLIVTSNQSWGKAMGYYEADFLGTGITSNNNQSNSYVLRQREVWAQAAMKNGFTFTTGQMWSMATELKKGINEAPGAENLPMTIDPQYHVGFSWTRQWGARFTQSFNNNKEFIGLSLEEPQIVNYTSNTTPPDFFIGGIGVNGGLYNLTNKYTNNLAPDLIVKFAADPGFGHWEIGAIARFFRSRIYPNQVANNAAANTTGAYNNTVTGGGYFVNGRFDVTKKLNLGVHIMGGDGVNRYGTSQLADVTVHTDGSLEPLRGLQGLFSIEAHPTKKLDIFGYAGAEYAQRTVYTGNVNGLGVVTIGYAPVSINTSTCYTEQATVVPPTVTGTGGTASGSANTGTIFGGSPYDPSSSCGAQTRYIAEGTAGFTYRFFNSPTKGRFQYSMVYSYLTKTAWVGTAGAPTASNNMIFTGFRYYIP